MSLIISNHLTDKQKAILQKMEYYGTYDLTVSEATHLIEELFEEKRLDNKAEGRDYRQTILDKFYGGERKPYYHGFDVDNGMCYHCNIFIGDARAKICQVITPDEVSRFRDYDNR